MIRNHLCQLITGEMGHTPTKGQQNAIATLSDFIVSDDSDSVFLLKGYAGTGKTTLVGAVVRVLNQYRIRTVLLAPTGRAAKIIAKYSGFPAYTIHKRIYRQRSAADPSSHFDLDRNSNAYTFFIVDESSMISNEGYDWNVFGSGRLLDDLMQYVYNGRHCRLILIGDTAQLPPVGLAVSPALDAEALESFGKNVYNCELTEVIRQVADSGILSCATDIRTLLQSENFIPGYFFIRCEGFPDVRKISGADLIDLIQTCYDRYGVEDTMVITRSNQRANQFNQGIRNSVLFRESEITTGDLLMVVKNNYHWLTQNDQVDFIANGDIAEVVKIKRFIDLYGFRFAEVTLHFVDYQNLEVDCKIFLDTLQIKSASFEKEDLQRLYNAVGEDYADIKNKKERWKKIRENDYYNALQVKFAYAVTCHKAQGGQWKAVFLDQGYLTEDKIDIEYLRWLYTAFTRASEQLYLVNFNKQFFDRAFINREEV